MKYTGVRVFPSKCNCGSGLRHVCCKIEEMTCFPVHNSRGLQMAGGGVTMCSKGVTISVPDSDNDREG